MIGLMGAMEEEVGLYTSYADIDFTQRYAGMDFHKGNIEGGEVVIVQCGIGKVSAAVSTQILIDRFDIDMVILTGLAGSLVPYLQQGDIVVSNYLVQYDVDLTAFGRRVGELPEVGRMIEADPQIVNRITEAYDTVFGGRPDRPQLVVGTVVSGDRFVSDKKKISWLQREFGALATEMEGAAVGQVCYLNKLPFAVIRTISDDATEDAGDQFSKSLEMAPINTFALLKRLISVDVMESAPQIQPEKVGPV